MSNFLTAKQGNLDPIVTWFTVQGDKYWTGDNAQIKNSAGTWVNISNTLNPVNNAMNATVTDNDEHMVDKVSREICAKEIVEPKETYKVGETITYRVSLKIQKLILKR